MDTIDQQTGDLDSNEQANVTEPVGTNQDMVTRSESLSLPEMPAAPNETKYQAISLLAAQYAEAYLAHKQSCNDLAHDFFAATRDFFGAPDESFKLVRLMDDLRRDNSPGAQYDLTQGRDGFWYCGLTMMFESAERGFSEVSIPVGFQIVGDKATFRLKGDRSIDMTASDRWASTLAQMEAELHDYYLRPVIELRAPLGFVP